MTAEPIDITPVDPMTAETRSAIRDYESASLQVANVRQAAKMLRNELRRLRPALATGALVGILSIVLTPAELVFQTELGETFRINDPYPPEMSW